ncbi:MAG: hypothetical protein IPK26_00580 [Planctomycetes bacterium]|nr:hypothetical protein [Planctomycetota bacterium]
MNAATAARVLIPSLVLLGSLLRAQRDYMPMGPEVVLNTDFTQIQPTQGPPINVTGGIFVFRNVTIPAGVRVRGVGTRPMIWIVSGQFLVDGELSVNGEDGQRVDTLNSANFPAIGGQGGAAGGRGGHGSPDALMRDAFGQNGFDPLNVMGLGGGGGLLSCLTGLGRGSAGGGGAFATEGDPFFLVGPGAGTSFQQVRGVGGQGGFGVSGSATRAPNGGRVGLRPFVDGNDGNDFFGTAVDVATRRPVLGELTVLMGGQGGGGGGDLSFNNSCVLADPNFANDPKGGGGGGGGGCLVIAAAGPIVVGAQGRITANGGHGGGGEQAGSCNRGGGGGGGSGGMLILASATAIGLNVKGETYANNDYDFCLSADGGVCRTGTFGTPVVVRKYPNSGQTLPASFGASYDSAPLGGFGGLGVIQLIAPFGNNADGTNTHLDDGILLVRNGNLLSGAQKQRFLGWRGFPNAQGLRVDDFGNPLPTGRTDGDIRPAPVLMPLF